MTESPYRLYAWPLSYYSGKVRAYLRHKGLPFRECSPRAWDMHRIKRHVGAAAMPVLVTPQGDWLLDSSHIIDVLEARHPQVSVLPESPIQRLAAGLLEVWGDEFWLPAALHFRWHYSENEREQFLPEAGDALLPGAPRWLKNLAAGRAVSMLRGYLPGLGVTVEQAETLEGWTDAMLDVLEDHFAHHRYLLGDRPCLGDFGLLGPLYAHLGRDPWPRRELMGPRPQLYAWVQRMHDPAAAISSARGFLPHDVLPTTLAPLFESIFGEMLPWLAQLRRQVSVADPPAPGRGYPRQLEPVRLSLGGHAFVRNATPFSLWKLQRVLDGRNKMSPAQRSLGDAWLNAQGGLDAVDDLAVAPRLKRLGLHVAPA
mgnify:CR=1 FL=1